MTLLASFLRAVPVAAIAGLASLATAQIDTTFSYQGELLTDGQPATGAFDLRFRLFDAAIGGGQVGQTLCIDGQSIDQGRFAVLLNFGPVFGGAARFLEIAVRTDAGGSCAQTEGFTVLAARLPLTATPYAVHALSAGDALLLNGQPPAFYTSATNLTGTLPDARLSPNVSFLTGAQTFSGLKTFTSPPTFASNGAPFVVAANGRVANLNADLLDGLDSTAFAGVVHTHDASAVVSGTLADARLPASIARRNATNDLTANQVITTPDFTPVVLRSSNASGLNITMQPLGAGGRAWSLLATASGNADGAGKFLLRDLVAGTARLSVDDGGNVGVGTTAPLERLHVVGPMHVASTTHEISYPTGRAFQIGEINTTTLDFNGRFTIAADGDTGIGTGSPFADLHIARNGVNVDVLLKRTEAQHGFNFGVNGAPKLFVSRSDGTSFDDYVTIDGPTGFVGIGTTNPIALLHVDGPVHLLGGAQALTWPAGQQFRIGSFNGTTFTPRLSVGAGGDFNIFANTFLQGAITAGQGSFNNPAGPGSLYVTQATTNASQGIAWFDRIGSDGPVIDILRDSVKIGGISAAGTVVSYNPFTGSHYATAPVDFEYATLLSMTGQNQTFGDRPGAEMVYGVRATTAANDPACIGSFLGRLTPGSAHSTANPHLVMAVGNGEMLVTTHDGLSPIAPGDLLISSDLPGHAMKLDPARFPVAHIVARAAEPLDWANVPVNGSGARSARISVFFTQFTRDATAQELARENAALRARLENLEARLRETGALRDW